MKEPLTVPDSVDFGFNTVTPVQKTERVRAVFSDVAARYDQMNDMLSAGLHRIWKRAFIAQAGIAPFHRVLDVASGTGDLVPLIVRRLKSDNRVFVSDVNAAMLQQAYSRLVDRGLLSRIVPVQANAEQLPFSHSALDRITVAFGLRNMTDKMRALQEAYRVLAPGGALHILEFSQPESWLRGAYDAYSFQAVPRIGEWVTGHAEHYRYLVESIRRHPNQEALAGMLRTAGFERVAYRNLSAGIVAMHVGYRL